MRKLLLAASLALAPLAGCATTEIPTVPAEVAQHTAADEQGRLRCEQTYKLSRTLGELAVDVPNLVRGQTAVTLASLDNRLFAALGVCRAAYRAFNSTGITQAANEIDSLSDQVRTVLGRAN